MRAMRLIPEVEEKLTSGELNLTSLSQAQSLFRHEAKAGKNYSIEQKREVLQKLENKSTRECEREIAAISPLAIPQEKRRILVANDKGESKTEMKVVLDQDLVAKLDKIKALLSHKNPQMTDRELLEVMADLTLSRLDPAKRLSSQKVVKPEKRVPAGNQRVDDAEQKTLVSEEEVHFSKKGSYVPNRNAVARRSAPVVASRYISQKVKRPVWIRDGGKCTHPGCLATHFLEYDHIVPHSMGGLSTVENLRLLCRVHNQRAAIDRFGIQKMEPYFKKQTTPQRELIERR